ncbi:ATP-dependent DNA ligase [bacterium]|nr:MAG: ATP-dependent DNA ligase [bacterium]
MAESTLTTYRKRRDFRRSPEPRGARGRRAGARFVVQLHRASHLHYDFRLEMDGVLKSWAVPKGPSLDPGVKRLAMHVEDHPLEYGAFEGRIPEGSYGAGDVIVWDSGTYELLKGASGAAAYRRGSLKFALHGRKLRGGFALVKMKRRDPNANAWLLIKERDGEADPRWRAAAHPASVLSGRTLDDATDPAPAVSNPEKILFPDDGITKRDLVAYYQRIAKRILPYLRDRPLMLERYPDGIGGAFFFAKDVPRGAPPWLTTVALESESAKRTIRYVVCNDERSLLYLANLAAVTLHVWQSQVSSLDFPDVLLFDLDPMPECPLRRVARVALSVRDILASVGLSSRVKTTGGTGLHVIVALHPDTPYAAVRRFVELVARRIVDVLPDQVTLDRTVSRRPPGVVYLDVAQVGRGKTFAVPYTARPRPGAPVSMPLTWERVEAWLKSRIADPAAAFAQWRIENAADSPDPWQSSYGHLQRLEPAFERARNEWRNG